MEEKYRDAYGALVYVAIKEGIPVEQVIRSIEETICEGYSSVIQNGDQEKIALWKQIPREGEIPNALEFMDYVGNQLKQLS